MKDLEFAPYDPEWREVLFSLLDRHWQIDRERVTLTLDRLRHEARDPALALELARAWFEHVIDFTPGVIRVVYPDGTPVLDESGAPVYRRVAPT